MRWAYSTKLLSPCAHRRSKPNHNHSTQHNLCRLVLIFAICTLCHQFITGHVSIVIVIKAYLMQMKSIRIRKWSSGLLYSLMYLKFLWMNSSISTHSGASWMCWSLYRSPAILKSCLLSKMWSAYTSNDVLFGSAQILNSIIFPPHQQTLSQRHTRLTQVLGHLVSSHLTAVGIRQCHFGMPRCSASNSNDPSFAFRAANAGRI